MPRLKKSSPTASYLLPGVIGPIVFIVVFLIESATRPGYSSWRNYVSDLALSGQGWEQTANFIVCGASYIAFGLGLRKVWPTGKAAIWGPRLLEIAGAELIIAGLFGIDPGRGYPPGTALNAEPHTVHAFVHGINGLIIFNVVLPAACFVIARRFAGTPDSRWATYSRATGALVLLLSLLSTLTSPLVEKRGVPFPIGLVQRAQIILDWVWVAGLAFWLWRRLPQALDAHSLHRSDPPMRE